MCYFSGIKCLDELREDNISVIFKTRYEFEAMLLTELYNFYKQPKLVLEITPELRKVITKGKKNETGKR